MILEGNFELDVRDGRWMTLVYDQFQFSVFMLAV
jgi:hypothetical protein